VSQGGARSVGDSIDFDGGTRARLYRESSQFREARTISFGKHRTEKKLRLGELQLLEVRDRLWVASRGHGMREGGYVRLIDPDRFQNDAR
jgi:hypothetical protein